MKCPLCEGEGYHIQHADEWGTLTTPCQICEGNGQIDFFHWLSLMFWHNAPIWFVEWHGELRYPFDDKEQRQEELFNE